MNKEKKTEVKVGLTVIAGLVLFIWVLGWAKNFSLTDNSQYVKVEFTTVSGLNNGDIVTVSGVKKGFVDNISLMNNKAIATLSIDNDIQLFTDALFSVAMLDLMGGKKVEILPGDSNKPLNLEEIHTGTFAGDISSAMAALSSVQTDIVILIKEVRDAVTKVNSSFLSDKFIATVNKNLSNLNTLLRSTTKLIEENSGDISSLIDNSNTLITQSSKLLNENEEELGNGIKNLNIMLTNSNKLLTRLNKFSEEIESGRNNLGKLINDKKLFDDIKSALKNTNELIKILLNQIEEEGIKVDANIF